MDEDREGEFPLLKITSNSSKHYYSHSKPSSNIQQSNKRCLHLVIILLLLQTLFLLKFNSNDIYSLFEVNTKQNVLAPQQSSSRRYPLPNTDSWQARIQEVRQSDPKPKKLEESIPSESKPQESKPPPETTPNNKSPDPTTNNIQVVEEADQNFNYPAVPRPELLECPENPPRLNGRVAVEYEKPYPGFHKDFKDSTHFPPSIEELAEHFSHSNHFSVFHPANYTDAPCNPPYAGSSVAIIICYRNREVQLRFFLLYMLPIFIRQQIQFKIYIIEQIEKTTFNRAKLFNVGFELAKNDPAGIDWDCYTFHDVDLILENDKLLYRCNEAGTPRHLSVAVSTFNYKLPYSAIFGGVTQMPADKFEHVNGYSNKYWGWGGEDDDMYRRVFKYGKYKFNRPDIKVARYKMITHVHEVSNKANPDRFSLLKRWEQRRELDGLKQIQSQESKYEIKARKLTGIYENILVDIGDKPSARH